MYSMKFVLDYLERIGYEYIDDIDIGATTLVKYLSYYPNYFKQVDGECKTNSSKRLRIAGDLTAIQLFKCTQPEGWGETDG